MIGVEHWPSGNEEAYGKGQDVEFPSHPLLLVGTNSRWERDMEPCQERE